MINTKKHRENIPAFKMIILLLLSLVLASALLYCALLVNQDSVGFAARNIYADPVFSVINIAGALCVLVNILLLPKLKRLGIFYSVFASGVFLVIASLQRSL
jgi:hypothetical protein